MSRPKTIAVALLSVLFGASCELVLGHLPAAVDSSAGGGGATSSVMSSSSGTGGASSSGASDSSSRASSSVGSSGGCCDCDGDGYKAIGPCGGTDCNDANAFVHPKEKQYYSKPIPQGGFDWNCDGMEEPDPAIYKTLDCTTVPPPCTSAGEGYLAVTPPACGDTGQWGTCVLQLAVCVDSIIDNAQPMRCR